MRRMAWGIALVVAFLWSLLAWAAYALVGWVGNVAVAHADWVTAHPDALSWLAWVGGMLTGVGLVGVVILWLLGVVLILAAPVVLRLFGRRGDRQATGPAWSGRLPAGWDRKGPWR